MNQVDRKAYVSPFAQIDYSGSEPHQPYEGSLNSLLNDLERGADLPLHPSRVV